jgi:hypothetical protein
MFFPRHDNMDAMDRAHGARCPDHAAQQAAGAFLLGWCAQKAKLL